MTDPEWKIMRSLSHAQEDQQTLAQLIEDFTFDGLGHAQAFALEAFEITRDNVKKHISVAKKIADFDAVGLRLEFRIGLLKALIDELLPSNFCNQEKE